MNKPVIITEVDGTRRPATKREVASLRKESKQRHKEVQRTYARAKYEYQRFESESPYGFYVEGYSHSYSDEHKQEQDRLYEQYADARAQLADFEVVLIVLGAMELVEPPA